MTKRQGKDRKAGADRDAPTKLLGSTRAAGLAAHGDDLWCAVDEAALHASLDRALDDSEAGRMTDAWEFLRAHRARLRQGARAKDML